MMTGIKNLLAIFANMEFQVLSRKMHHVMFLKQMYFMVSWVDLVTLVKLHRPSGIHCCHQYWPTDMPQRSCRLFEKCFL